MMSRRTDPKPPRKPAFPDQPDMRQRPNTPIGPARDAGHPVETPPEEKERERDPRSRDAL